MAKTGRLNKRYSPDFKIAVIEDMRNNNLGYAETVRKYSLGQTSERSAISRLLLWERIYIEEGPAGLTKERRGRKPASKPYNPDVEEAEKKLTPETERELIEAYQALKSENQRLRSEIEYLLKLSAEILAVERAKMRSKK